MRTRTRQPNAKRPATTERRPDNDAWVDQVSGPAPRVPASSHDRLDNRGSDEASLGTKVAPRSSARPSGTVLTRSTRDNDAWVDLVADEVQALLREHGLEMELCVWYDPIGEHLHAVGFDGSAARYFRSLESDRAPDAEVPPSSTPS